MTDTAPITRHRRLYAFYNSKVLSITGLIMVVALTLMGYSRSVTVPALCASVAFAFFAGYSLWLWVWKPRQIVVNKWLSDCDTWFVLYYLVSAFKEFPHWVYVVPLVAAIVVVFFDLVRPHDRLFDISQP